MPHEVTHEELKAQGDRILDRMSAGFESNDTDHERFGVTFERIGHSLDGRDGEPGIKTRLFVVEKVIMDIRKLFWILAAGAVAVIVDIIFQLVERA